MVFLHLRKFQNQPICFCKSTTNITILTLVLIVQEVIVKPQGDLLVLRNSGKKQCRENHAKHNNEKVQILPLPHFEENNRV